MRKLITFVTLLTLIVVLAACGGGTGGSAGGGGATTAGDAPDTVAQNWYNAFFNGDIDTVANLSCAAQRDSIRQSAQLLADARQNAPAQTEMDLSGLTFTVTGQTDTTATVTPSGMIRVTVAGQTIEQAIDEAGVPPVIELVREDNAWRVCSTA